MSYLSRPIDSACHNGAIKKKNFQIGEEIKELSHFCIIEVCLAVFARPKPETDLKTGFLNNSLFFLSIYKI